MTGTAVMLAELLANCDAQRIRLLLTSDGGLTIDAPKEALTPDLMDRLKSHKADVLAMLRPAPDVAAIVAARGAAAKHVCRCGSTTWSDVPIHCGQSIRQDCGRCGRFIDFPVWYGSHTLLNEQ